MVRTKPQAISGVSPDAEQTLVSRYPSIACIGLFGPGLGSLCESIPQPKLNGIKLSYLLFGLPAALLALPLYILLKVFGTRYVLTNRSVQVWKMLGSRMLSEVPLADIDRVDIRQSPGQVFYKAADLYLVNAGGQTIMRLESVVRADVFKQNILEARNARREVESALAVIQSRQRV